MYNGVLYSHICNKNLCKKNKAKSDLAKATPGYITQVACAFVDHVGMALDLKAYLFPYCFS